MRVRELSAFFPAFDEEANIERTVDRALAALRRLELDRFEIIVVDDGSRDATAAIADGLAEVHPEVRVVHHAVNRGYGAALHSGFAAAAFDWVFFSDGDGQFDLTEIEGFLAAAEVADVVVGYRIDRADHLGRRINTWLWGRFVRLTVRVDVRDIDCAFKLIARSVLERLPPLRATGATASTELLARIAQAGVPIVEIGVHHLPRLGGTPTGASPRVIARAFRELVVLRRELRRSRTATR